MLEGSEAGMAMTMPGARARRLETMENFIVAMLGELGWREER